MTNAANDSTMFSPMVEATEANLCHAARPGAVSANVADAGYWSVPNVTHPVDAEVLITPLPATNGIVDPDDPQTWARHLRNERRRGGADPARLRKQMLDRLAGDEGKARYAKRKITVEPCSATSRPTWASAVSPGAPPRPC